MSSAGSRPDDEHGRALEAARDALSRHDWPAAYEATEPSALPDPLDEATRLDVRAEAAWWLGRMDECIAAREAAYGIFDECGANREAGRCAVWLYEHHRFTAQPIIARAWLRRARHRLDGDVDCAEYGSLVLREVEMAHGSGELDLAAEQARAVIDLGRRLRAGGSRSGGPADPRSRAHRPR